MCHVLDADPSFDLDFSRDIWVPVLHYSCIMRETKCALELLKRGADPNLIDMLGVSPLNYSVSKFKYNPNRSSILGTKMRKNEEIPEVVIKLIIQGADVSHVNSYTGLFSHVQAVRSGYLYSYERIRSKVETILLNQSKYPKEFGLLNGWCQDEQKRGDALGKTIKLITHGCEERNIIKSIDEISEKLGKDFIHGIDQHGQTLLHYAVVKNMKVLVEDLIFRGMDESRVSKKKCTAFDLTSLLVKGEDRKMALHFRDCVTRFEKIKNKSTIDNKSGIESPKTDSEDLSDIEAFNFCENFMAEEEKKASKTSLKKKRKKERDKEKKERSMSDKLISEEELLLMGKEDIRTQDLIEKKRLQINTYNFNRFTEKLFNKIEIGMIKQAFSKLINNVRNLKDMEKQIKKKRNKAVKKIDQSLTKIVNNNMKRFMIKYMKIFFENIRLYLIDQNSNKYKKFFFNCELEYGFHNYIEGR